MPARVLGLGQCSLDYLTTVDAYPPADAKCEFRQLVIDGGGPVATALVALSRWGIDCAFAGVVGDDDFGRRIHASLEAEAIDLRGLVVRGDCTSQFAFIAADPATGSRTVFWRRPTGAALRPSEVDADAIRAATVFHTDGLFLDAALHAAEVARDAGVQVVVDAGTLREGMLDLARRSDVYIASEAFARQLVGADDPAAACRRLAALGPRLVGVTLGPRGYVALEDGTLVERGAVATHAIDTTGCGDVFHAGVIYGSIQGWSSSRALDFGAWAAARVATRLGGRAGIPSVDAYPLDRVSG